MKECMSGSIGEKRGREGGRIKQVTDEKISKERLVCLSKLTVVNLGYFDYEGVGEGEGRDGRLHV